MKGKELLPPSLTDFLPPQPIFEIVHVINSIFIHICNPPYSYSWLFLSVKGSQKCELNCRAVGYRFYVRQAEEVIDGTPCDQNGTSICVSGQCKVRVALISHEKWFAKLKTWCFIIFVICFYKWVCQKEQEENLFHLWLFHVLPFLLYDRENQYLNLGTKPMWCLFLILGSHLSWRTIWIFSYVCLFWIPIYDLLCLYVLQFVFNRHVFTTLPLPILL